VYSDRARLVFFVTEVAQVLGDLHSRELIQEHVSERGLDVILDNAFPR
jgi:hypothetical protein